MRLTLVIMLLVAIIIESFIFYHSLRSKTNINDKLDGLAEKQRYQYNKTLKTIIFFKSVLIQTGLLLILGLNLLYFSLNTNYSEVLLFLILLYFFFVYFWAYYIVLRLDRRFGLTFISRVKNFVFVVIGCFSPLLVLLLSIFYVRHIEAFLGLAIIVVILSILIYVTFKIISSKDIKIEDQELIELVESFAKEHKIKCKGLYKKRTHNTTTVINAHVKNSFLGKKVVLYDTMLQNFTLEEILFVIGHEFGHLKKKHFLVLGFSYTIVIIASLFLLYNVIVSDKSYLDFGFLEFNFMNMLIVLYAFILTTWKLIKVILNYISRVLEYSADEFSVKALGKDGLIKALMKISATNLEDLHPSELDVIFNYSHPTISQRIKRANLI